MSINDKDQIAILTSVSWKFVVNTIVISNWVYYKLKKILVIEICYKLLHAKSLSIFYKKIFIFVTDNFWTKHWYYYHSCKRNQYGPALKIDQIFTSYIIDVIWQFWLFDFYFLNWYRTLISKINLLGWISKPEWYGYWGYPGSEFG